MKLCRCNNCSWLYDDKNPQVGAVDYPDNMPVDSLVWQRDIDDLEWTWCCPICETDGFLSDDVTYDDIEKLTDKCK